MITYAMFELLEWVELVVAIHKICPDVKLNDDVDNSILGLLWFSLLEDSLSVGL